MAAGIGIDTENRRIVIQAKFVLYMLILPAPLVVAAQNNEEGGFLLRGLMVEANFGSTNLVRVYLRTWRFVRISG